MEFYDFPFIWECRHPNWRSYIFQKGRYTTNQISSPFISIHLDMFHFFDSTNKNGTSVVCSFFRSCGHARTMRQRPWLPGHQLLSDAFGVVLTLWQVDSSRWGWKYHEIPWIKPWGCFIWAIRFLVAGTDCHWGYPSQQSGCAIPGFLGRDMSEPDPVLDDHSGWPYYSSFNGESRQPEDFI